MEQEIYRFLTVPDDVVGLEPDVAKATILLVVRQKVDSKNVKT